MLRQLLLLQEMKNKALLFFVSFSLLLFGFHKSALTSYTASRKTSIVANGKDSLKIELGRILFYDPQFSADLQTSCASCHSSYHAFAHTDHALSHGNFDSLGNRNAPGLFNLHFRKVFMRDGAVHRLDLQALSPLHSPFEMGSHIDSALQIINHNSDYRSACFDAWGDSLMSVTTFLKSLEYFETSLISMNAYWDKVQNGSQKFSSMQQAGEMVFVQLCQSCHAPPLFQDEKFHRIWDTTYASDLGRYNITHDPKDRYAFMTPSLRNLDFTYPYTHDGRYNHLRKCLEDHLIPQLNSKKALKEIIEEKEITELIAFLHTLNDTAFVLNKQHQFPRNSFLMKTK